ncbi:hypothetical protein HDU86_000111 [Geranomyces michiganensis]|nr:hypothetical protein HDU86_000111 [Geranomyces michiganensis]
MPAPAADGLLAAGLQPTHIFIIAKTCSSLAEQVRHSVLPKDVRVVLVAGSCSHEAPSVSDALWAGRGTVVSEKNLAAFLRRLDKKCPQITAFNWIAPPPTTLPVKLNRTISALFPPPSFGAYLISQLSPETQKAVNSAFARAIDDAASLIGVFGIVDLRATLSKVMSEDVIEYVVCLLSLAGAIIISSGGVIEVVLATLLTLAPMPGQSVGDGQQDEVFDPYEEEEEMESEDDDDDAEEDEDQSDDDDLSNPAIILSTTDMPEDVIALKDAIEGSSRLDHSAAANFASKPAAAGTSLHDTSDHAQSDAFRPPVKPPKLGLSLSEANDSPVSARTLARLPDIPFEPEPITPEDGSTPFLVRLRNFTKEHFAASKDLKFCKSARSPAGRYRCRLTVAEQSFESAYLFKDEDEAAEDVARLACAFMFCWVEAAGRTEQFSGRLEDIFDANATNGDEREDGEVLEPAQGTELTAAEHPLIDESAAPAVKGQRPFITLINHYVIRRSTSLTWSFPGHAPGARVHSAVLTIAGVDYASRQSHSKRQDAKEDAAEVACLELCISDDQPIDKRVKSGTSPSRTNGTNAAMILNQLCQRRGTTHSAVFDKTAEGFSCTLSVDDTTWSSGLRFKKRGDAKAAACVNALRDLAPNSLENDSTTPNAGEKGNQISNAYSDRSPKRARYSDSSDRPATVHHALPPRPAVCPPPTIRHTPPNMYSPTNNIPQAYPQPPQQYPSFPTNMSPYPQNSPGASLQYPSFPSAQTIASSQLTMAQQPMDINTAMAVFASVFSGPAALPLTALSSLVPGAGGVALQGLAPIFQQLSTANACTPQNPNPLLPPQLSSETSLQNAIVPESAVQQQQRPQRPLIDGQHNAPRPRGKHKRFLESE